jgi:hypothetical protein
MHKLETEGTEQQETSDSVDLNPARQDRITEEQQVATYMQLQSRRALGVGDDRSGDGIDEGCAACA